MTRGRTLYRSLLSVLEAVLIVFLFRTGANAQKPVVRVAAAADLQYAMSDLVLHFEHRTGVKVNVTYGSSGNFFSQIQNGAPFDLFFSADTDYPKKLAAADFAEPPTLFYYAVGRIVIWTPPGASIDVAREGWNTLLDDRVRKIAIATPQHAPYGRAALAALKNAGIYEEVKSKLVYGEDISQAAQFVQSGNAQAGILAKSLVYSPAMRGGKSWNIPGNLYPTILQGAVLLRSAANKKSAKAFLEFVRGPSGRLTLDAWGLDAPEASDLGASHQ